MIYFVFNYALLKKAHHIHKKLKNLNKSSYILSSPHSSDFRIHDDNVIIYESNMYYGGLYNKALEIADGENFMIINSDNIIKDYSILCARAELFFNSYRSPGIYAPSIKEGGTFWNYNRSLLGTADIYRNWARAPITDGTCWAINGELAKRIGPIDTTKNKIGWGIDVIAAMEASKVGLHTIIDYDVEIVHPAETIYSIDKAHKEELDYVSSIGISVDYLHYKHAARQLVLNK